MNPSLKNRWLTASFSPEDGGLRRLSSVGGLNLVARSSLRSYDAAARLWRSDDPALPGERFSLQSLVAGKETVTVVSRSADLETTIEWHLPPQSPLLRARVRVRGLGSGAKLGFLAMPRITLARGFNDIFEDEQDLWSDGAELGGGRELPCWRVFFRKGWKSGLILATRCKEEMARFNVLADGFDREPHGTWNYTSMPVSGRTPLSAESGTAYEGEFEIGPWLQGKHAAILRGARLTAPVAVGPLPARGRAPAGLKGRVFHARDFAGERTAGRTYHARRWQLARVPWSASGEALFATTGVRPPALTLDPGLTGWWKVYAGIGNGAGIALRASGEPYARIRLRSGTNADTRAGAFELALAGAHRAAEVEFGTMRMDGRTLRLTRFPDTQLPCMLDYVRLEPLSPAEVRRLEGQEAVSSKWPLSGFADIPDISVLLDARNPDPKTFAANVWEHAHAGFGRIHWRVDGQCSDFPCSCNTLRYVSAKVHGVYCPHAKAYGRALKRADLLRLAVAAARKYNVDLWGWMRFNNYTGNVQSEFFRTHPEFWEENEAGSRGRQLCLAHPEVRRHKISILVEAARYGLGGLCLGFLRHPPVIQYAPIMREAYAREYGKPPPRDPAHPDRAHTTTLPERGDPEYVRWWGFRARYLTLFGRELRRALAEAGLAAVKVAIWVRPNHCLFDGIDLDAWLDEGLCDEVITQQYVMNNPNPDIYWERPEWRARVRRCVPLTRGIWCHYPTARADVKRIRAGGYDGLCSYESNQTALDSDFIRLFRSLRTGGGRK